MALAKRLSSKTPDACDLTKLFPTSNIRHSGAPNGVSIDRPESSPPYFPNLGRGWIPAYAPNGVSIDGMTGFLGLTD